MVDLEIGVGAELLRHVEGRRREDAPEVGREEAGGEVVAGALASVHKAAILRPRPVTQFVEAGQKIRPTVI